MTTINKIIEFIREKGQATPADLSRQIGVGRAATHRQIKKLLEKKILGKIGQPPKVFYYLKNAPQGRPSTANLSARLSKVINTNFLIITPTGEWREGAEGFIYWCQKHQLPIEKTAEEYEKTLQKYAQYKSNGLIDGAYKIKKTFAQVFLDKIFYLEFYSIERFGKTRLGQMLLYAKQSQNQNLIKKLIEQIKPLVNKLIKNYKIEAVGFIPPTVKREIQLMKELERYLDLTVPVVNLTKIKTPIIIPQKTLSKLEDRIENAEKTIILEEKAKYKTVLLIDDAVGSGATLNKTAEKIKKSGIANTVIGLALVGSFSGFEIISEV